MKVLGIETSCDETGLAVYDSARGLLAHALHSQVAMHDAYGGVVPELASRDHIRRVVPLTERVLAAYRSSARGPTASAATDVARLAELTPRELDVLRLLARGLPNKLIARELGIAERTVKTHVSSIFAKLGVTDRTQAALYAVRERLADA